MASDIATTNDSEHRKSFDTIFLTQEAQRVYEEHESEYRALTDRLFAVLAVVLWGATISVYGLGLLASKLAAFEIVTTVISLIAIGGAFVAAPLFWSFKNPGHRLTPYLAAISLSVCTVLFMRVSGRSDSILAAFVVLSFLAFYRNKIALSVATAIVVSSIVAATLDAHDIVRSLVTDMVSARSEDIFWLLILDIVLYASISKMSTGLRRGSLQQANLQALQDESVQSIAIRDQQLQESEMVKTMIFESAPDAVIRYDQDLRVIEINAVAERMLQIEKKDSHELNLAAIIADAEKMTRQSSGSSESERFLETKVLRSDGSQFVAEVSVAEVFGLASRQFAMFVRDITERKSLESQVTESRKLQSIGQLAAGIAHEINTPTQYVGDNTLFLEDSFKDIEQLLGAYTMLEEASAVHPELESTIQIVEEAKEKADLEFLREELPKAIRESLDGIERISVIVRALKDFSHPGVEGMTAAEINRILESTATVARNEWKYVAELELDLCASLPPILCLPGELGQVALNLIVNASHAIADKAAESGQKGLIKVSTACDDSYITVRISDNGGGIPKSVRDRIFDPFFTTKEVGKGTGQGLAIARNVIVERHKGQLWFETEEGVGTTFIFKIPMNLSPEESLEEAA